MMPSADHCSSSTCPEALGGDLRRVSGSPQAVAEPTLIHSLYHTTQPPPHPPSPAELTPVPATSGTSATPRAAP